MSRSAANKLGSIRALQIQDNRSNPLEGRGYDSECYESDNDSLNGGNGELTNLRAVGGGRSRRLTKAHKLGKQVAHELHNLHGAGFFDDFKQGFNSVFTPIAGIAKSLAPLAGPEGNVVSGALGALGYGRKRGGRLGEDGHGQFHPFQELEAPVEGSGILSSLLGILGNGKKKRMSKKRGGMAGEDGHGEFHPFQELHDPHGSGIIRSVRSAIDKINGHGKRKMSDKTKRRHELINKLMKKHGISMTAANKYIRDHKMKY